MSFSSLESSLRQNRKLVSLSQSYVVLGSTSPNSNPEISILSRKWKIANAERWGLVNLMGYNRTKAHWKNILKTVNLEVWFKNWEHCQNTWMECVWSLLGLVNKFERGEMIDQQIITLFLNYKNSFLLKKSYEEMQITKLLESPEIVFFPFFFFFFFFFFFLRLLDFKTFWFLKAF